MAKRRKDKQRMSTPQTQAVKPHQAPGQVGRGRPAQRTQETIDEAVKRHLEGKEQVTTLCKYYGVSKAGFYLWVTNYKNRVLEQSKRSGMTTEGIEKAERSELVVQVAQLQAENRKLRDRLVSLMMKYGDDV